MARRLLPPDPWGITPYAQRVQMGADPKEFYSRSTFAQAPVMDRVSTHGGDHMAMRRRRATTTEEKARETTESLFKTAPQNRSAAKKIEDAGEARAAAPKDEGSKRRHDPRLEIATEDLPMLTAPWMKIQERVFNVPDPEAEYAELEEALRLTDALTPGNLQAALNSAEDNARRAHRLYIVARVEFERFELECGPVMEAMRDAAAKDLQGEKDRKERSKQITESDIKGRASILFPDEWGLVNSRRVKAEGMMDNLKVFANVWMQRCFSLSSMLNAGKRS